VSRPAERRLDGARGSGGAQRVAWAAQTWTIGRDRARRLNSPGSARLGIVFASGLLALLLYAWPALAVPANGNGNYTQILCADPTSGEGLGIGGMPEGLSNPASVDTWQITTTAAKCPAGPLTPSGGVPLSVGKGDTYPEGTWSALVYQAPAGVTINGGAIYRAERAEGANNGFMGIDQQGGDPGTLYALPRNFEDSGDWYAGNVGSRGVFSWPFSPENIVNLTVSPDGGHWDVNATCDPNGNNNSSCTLTSGEWEYRVFGGEISLHATGDPQASNISGPLASDPVLHGSESLTFSASDQGPGLAYVKFVVDSLIVQSQIVDTNSGHCIPVSGEGAYTWAYEVPCKTSLGGRTYSLNTATLLDGAHHVRVLIEDAAGNQSIVLDRTVASENAASATAPTGGPAPGPDTGGSGGALHPALGTGNGTGASKLAQLRLTGGAAITRLFAHRALTIAGALLDASGGPIANATLDVREQSAASASARIVAHATTGADGSFTVRVAAGPSRRIIIAYRAFATDNAYSAQASIEESVSAGVQLHITPMRTSPAGAITIAGGVSGPIPQQGVVVELLVHYRGAWEPFRDPRTDSRGRFRVRYRFQGAVGRFPFRAEVLGRQSEFPYATGLSAPVDVVCR